MTETVSLHTHQHLILSLFFILDSNIIFKMSVFSQIHLLAFIEIISWYLLLDLLMNCIILSINIHIYFPLNIAFYFWGERIGGVRGRKQGPTGVSKVYETSSIRMG